MGTYRFSWLRPGGWNRLGGVGAMCVLFGTPMMWALGVFGTGDDSLKLASVFLLAGIWFCVCLGYGIGWAVRGFMAKVKDGDGDEDSPATTREPPRPPVSGHAVAGHRPGH